MVALNNRRRKGLNEENKRYYEDMIVYLRTSSVPGKQREELLLELLDHLLIVQKEGRSARDVFGPDPKAYLEDIVQSVGTQPLFSFKRYMFFFSVGLYVVFLIDGLSRLLVDPLLHHFFDLPQKRGFSIDWLIIPVFGVFLTEMIMFFLRKSTFKRRGRQILWFLVPQFIVFSGFFLLYFFMKERIPAMPIAAWMSLLVGGILWGMHKLVFKNAELL